MNTECDMLAKEAVENSLHQPTRKQKEQLLPLEPASLGVDGVKQTSNLALAVRGAMERKDAERFYREELGWPKVTFTCIHWDGLNDALESKWNPFRLWLSKQANGSCGTQAMVSRWDKTRDNLCPDCGTKETAAHLMVCPGHSRTLLLKQEVDDLERWMRNNNTDNALAFWISK